MACTAVKHPLKDWRRRPRAKTDSGQLGASRCATALAEKSEELFIWWPRCPIWIGADPFDPRECTLASHVLAERLHSLLACSFFFVRVASRPYLFITARTKGLNGGWWGVRGLTSVHAVGMPRRQRQAAATTPSDAPLQDGVHPLAVPVAEVPARRDLEQDDRRAHGVRRPRGSDEGSIGIPIPRAGVRSKPPSISNRPDGILLC